MGAYKVRRYCRDCKKVVTATMYMNTEHIDGRTYESGVDRIACGECGSIDVVDYNACPICGEPKSEFDTYCPECYGLTKQYLDDLKSDLGASAGDLEEIVCNVLGV